MFLLPAQGILLIIKPCWTLLTSQILNYDHFHVNQSIIFFHRKVNFLWNFSQQVNFKMAPLKQWCISVSVSSKGSNFCVSGGGLSFCCVSVSVILVCCVSMCATEKYYCLVTDFAQKKYRLLVNNIDKIIDYLQKYYFQFQTLKCYFRLFSYIKIYMYWWIRKKKSCQGKLIICWELKFHCKRKCKRRTLRIDCKHKCKQLWILQCKRKRKKGGCKRKQLDNLLLIHACSEVE